jgi:chromosome segregation ATPase
MAGGKHKNRSNRKQGYLASSELNSPTIAIPGYTIKPEKQDMDLKSLLMMTMEDFKTEINNSLKEIQENKSKQLEALKEETQKSLKELQENTTKMVKELNKNIQNLKMEVETIKKSQRETTQEIETLGNKSGSIDASISNRIQEMEERISGEEDSIKNMDKKNQRKCKMQKDLNSKHPGNPGQNDKTKPKDNRYG